MIPREKHILMLQRMMRIRFFENKLIECQKAGEIVGALHTYTGEEGVAVGACVALNDDDYIAGNHRSHGHPCLLYTSPSPRDSFRSRMPSSA